MPLAVGRRLGLYEVTGLLGAGGMGEVYRARDTKLQRDVAIKVLPDALAHDTERLARFEREARTLASLNHPQIGQIYGLEESDGIKALVLELVEGPTLADRIAEGPIPLNEALPMARQIAEALEAAHEQGIIHRDLKPANIKVRPDGTVKVLDFGLAKALVGEGSRPTSVTAANSPTITSPVGVTGVGVLLGTAAYMSPEQAKGRVVDKRSDVWAFGAVLYEMLTARRAFEGDDISDTLARILMKEPDWTALPTTVPAAVVTVIRRCLQKDRKQRVRDVGDVSLALEDAFETVAPHTTATATASTHGRHAWMAAFAVAVVGMIALGVPALRHVRETPQAATPRASLSMDLAPADRLGRTTFDGRPSRTAFAIAPDGATIVFVGEVERPSPSTMLYRRSLADAQAVAIPGTEGAEYPFFSPDGQSVGFGAGNKLKKVALSGGPPIDICEFAVGDRLRGASWGSAGVIAFADRGGLWTVSGSGGKSDAPFESSEAVSSPSMLPDGQTVLFTAVPRTFKWEDAHVDAINVVTKQRKRLLTHAADARYSATGHLVFARNAALLAVPFDATGVDVTGAPVPLLAGVMQSTNAPNGIDETGMGQFVLSASGTLLYASGDRYPTPTSVLTRVDRKGAETELAVIPGALVGARLDSAGGRVVAYKTGDGSRSSDIWLYDLPSGIPTRLTTTGDAAWPLFARDGKSVTFVKVGSEPGIHAVSQNGSPAPQRLIEGTAGLAAASWSLNGEWLAYLQNVGGVRQIFVRPAREGGPDVGEPRQFSPSSFNQQDAEFSPDSRWIAYSSNESGADEVYVQAFPGPGQKERISTTGGSNPAWSRDGRELFYLRGRAAALQRQMFAADVSTTGDVFKHSVPRQLFEGPYANSIPLRSYDVTADGQFILVRIQRPPDQPVTTLNVVLGWAEELKAKVPTGK